MTDVTCIAAASDRLVLSVIAFILAVILLLLTLFARYLARISSQREEFKRQLEDLADEIRRARTQNNEDNHANAKDKTD